MTARDILIDARDRIIDPKHWTRGAVARDRMGVPVLSLSRDATCWCAQGSMNRSWFGSDADGLPLPIVNASEQILNDTALDLYGTGIVAVNDNHGHDSVMAVYEVAISRA